MRPAARGIPARPARGGSKRVGITEASGGGYNTWITAALDDRIAAAVPVVGTSEFAEQVRVCRPLDWYHAAEHCHFVPGLIRYANNHELLAMAAPKPVLIIAASRTRASRSPGCGRSPTTAGSSTRPTASETRAGGGRGGGHGYQRAKREAAYGWFLRWLMRRGDGGPHPGALDRDRALRLEELRASPRPERAGRAGDDRGGAAAGATSPLAAADRSGSGPRPDAVGTAGPGPTRRRPAPAAVGPVGGGPRRPRVPAPPAGEVRGVLVALDDRGKEVLASDPVVETAHARAGRSAAWTPAASASRPPTRPAGCSP